MNNPKKPMRMVELIIDEDNLVEGVQAMGVVTKPAIMTNFVTFSEDGEPLPKKVKFEAMNSEKRILLGPAMIPGLPIYRQDEDGDGYYNYYTAKTVEQSMQLFMKNGRQNSATLEHEVGVSDLTIVESWIVEDETQDKSRIYGFDVPKGTWMISMKVYSEDIWNQFIKSGVLQGFSIEGFFSDSDSQKHKDKLKTAFQAYAKLAATRAKSSKSRR
jgi:hypothetical protein